MAGIGGCHEMIQDVEADAVQKPLICSSSATELEPLCATRRPTLVLEPDDDQDEIMRKLEQVGLAHRVIISSADPVKLDRKLSLCRQSSLDAEGTHPQYFRTPTTDLIMQRSSALAILLLLQSASSIVLVNYQELIEKHVFLALFLTMLTGTGGNAGNQSSALVIRGLSTGEIAAQNSMAVLTRELMISSVIGPILAGIAFVRVMMTEGCDLTAGVIISLTTYVTVVGAIAGGTLVPLVLDHFGYDPCHLSGPVLATITDVMGVLLLCIVTTFMLSIL